MKAPILMSSTYEASCDGLLKEQRCLCDTTPNCRGQREMVKDGERLTGFQ